MDTKEGYEPDANEAGVVGTNADYNLASSHDQLERGLKSRHIQFLALGTSSQDPLILC